MRIIQHSNFSGLRDKWDSLYKENSSYSPYQSAEYAEIAFSHYPPYAVLRRVKPVFYEILDEDATIMIIPLCKSVFRNEYTLFGYKSGYGYLDFIYRSDIGEKKIGECIDCLGNELKGSRLGINRLREDSLLCQYLKNKHEAKETICCVHIDLEDSYDAYFAALKKNVRHHVRTAYNRLEAEQKKVSMKMFAGKPLPEEEFANIMEIYLARRQSRYKLNEGMLMRQFIKSYDIGSVAMKKLNNYVHFILYIDNKAVAFCNGALSKDKNTLVLIRLAIDIDYAKYSPGILLLNESIKRIFEFNIANKLDMIQGDQRYKYEMGGKTHNCYDFELKF
jgi:hypothetical protein